jgi:hypothetical protein
VKVPAAKEIEIVELSPSTVSQHEQIQKLISPEAKQQVAQIAPVFSTHARQAPPDADLHAMAVADVRSGFKGTGILSDQNIEVLAFLVMVQAARNAQLDLKNIMGQAKNSNKQPQDPDKSPQDSLREMTDEDSRRLQMGMDRLSKLMSTLSNLLKKMADTAAAVNQNIQ